MNGPKARVAPAHMPAWWLWGVFGAALCARASWGVVRLLGSADPGRLEFPDEVDYWGLAQSLARGDGLVGEHGFRALRMPLYPAFLSLFASLDRGVVLAKAVQWVLGALAAVFVAQLASRLSRPLAGLLAGLAVAVDPFLVFFSSLLLTETPFITGLAALWLISWPIIADRDRSARWYRWLAVGGLAALCLYVREASAGLCVLWIALLAWGQRFRRAALAGGALAAAVIVVALLPWALRNHRVTGELRWLTNRGGISLYDGVGPQATGAGDLADIKQMAAVRGLGEAEWNRYFLNASLDAMRSDPWRIARLAVVKIGRTWNPVPNVGTYQSSLVRWVSAAWTIPVYALAMAGAVWLWRRDRFAAAALLLPAAYVLVMHAVFVGSVRYRLVAMPMLEVLAAVTLAALLNRRKASAALAIEGRQNRGRSESRR